MSFFTPPNPNTFANSPLDRAAQHRRDAAWIEAALKHDNAQVCVFHRGLPLVDDAGVVWVNPGAREAVRAGPAPLIFLGVDKDRSPYFAIEAHDSFDIDDSPLQGFGRFDDMRATAARVGAGDVAITGVARALYEWHRKNRFCANCAQATRVEEAGWRRKCDACATEHYPRVDPVVIMLPVKGDKCALGRQARFPGKMHSALAGFVEPGESIEEAVARETFEEVGLRVRHVRYHSTQPWPFPHTLMIGAICEVENEDIVVDTFELESARWITREEAKLMLVNAHPEVACPPPLAIAHQLIKAWAQD